MVYQNLVRTVGGGLVSLKLNIDYGLFDNRKENS